MSCALHCCVALVPNATSLGNVQVNIEEIGTYSETRECITDGELGEILGINGIALCYANAAWFIIQRKNDGRITKR